MDCCWPAQQSLPLVEGSSQGHCSPTERAPVGQVKGCRNRASNWESVPSSGGGRSQGSRARGCGEQVVEVSVVECGRGLTFDG